MDSVESSLIGSFKAKKIRRSSSEESPSLSDERGEKVPDRSIPWDTTTPEKPVFPPRRARNRGAALSLKEVRQAAERLRKAGLNPPGKPDPVTSMAKKDVSSLPESSPAKPKKLPEKYEVLNQFFHGLDSSIKLLNLKGRKTTFTNISAQVELLTDRRFTYTHLAQLKFILPEAIEARKILVHDMTTSVMKPDLLVTLNAAAEVEVKGKLKTADNAHGLLRKTFHARLVDFFRAHPKGDVEVPEGELPEPFCSQKQQRQVSVASLPDRTLAIATSSLQAQPAMAASHVSRSFRRSFSSSFAMSKAERTVQELPALSTHSPTAEEDHVSATTTPQKFLTPIKGDEKLAEAQESLSTCKGTPVGNVITPVKLMIATPSLQPTKRSYMSPDSDSISSPDKLLSRPPRSRSLKFDTPIKATSVEEDLGNSSVDADVLDVLPQSLLESIRAKERNALMEMDPAISEAKRRQKMISALPKLFDKIYFLFQSLKCTVITKQDLIQRIVSSNLDILDTIEVEEQLALLQELVPECLYEKLASTGDLLFRVNKMQSPESVRTRLAEAI